MTAKMMSPALMGRVIRIIGSKLDWSMARCKDTSARSVGL